MEEFFAPNVWVLGFLVLKKFLYVEIVALLALIRAFSARGPARWIAGLAFLVAMTGVAATFGPPMMNIWSGPLYVQSQSVLNAAGGFGAIFAASVVLALSGVVPGRRWPAIDLVHGLLFAVFAALWVFVG